MGSATTAGAAGGAAIGSAIPGLGTAVGAGIGAIGGGIVDFFGQQSANAQNWDQFVSNQIWNTQQISDARSYNTYMANTAHQREMADLQAAGLNPILAANGGAPSPTSPVTNPGTGSPIVNPAGGLGRALGSAIPDALTALQTQKALQNLDADTGAKIANALNQNAQATTQAATAKNLDIDTINKSLQTGAIKSEAAARDAVAKQNEKYAAAQKIIDMATQTLGGAASAINPITNILDVVNQIKTRNANTQIKGLKGVRVP